MPKYKITNISAQSPKGERNIFLVEVGKAVAPGGVAFCNTVQPSTWALARNKIVKVEEGDFPAVPVLSAADEERLAASNPERKPSKVVEVSGEKPTVAGSVPPPGTVPPPRDGGGEASTEGEQSGESSSDESSETDDGGSKRLGRSGGGSGKGKGRG